jgi:hypothetical protein
MISGLERSRASRPPNNRRPHTTSIEPTNGAMNCGLGMPIRANRPAPHCPTKSNFFTPSRKKTAPTASRMITVAAGASLSEILFQDTVENLFSRECSSRVRKLAYGQRLRLISRPSSDARLNPVSVDSLVRWDLGPGDGPTPRAIGATDPEIHRWSSQSQPHSACTRRSPEYPTTG